MLDITNEMANRYHIEFGEPKSKILKIGKSKENPEFTLGDMIMAYAEIYKYLGEILISKGNLSDHITAIKGKTEAAYQTLLQIAGDKHFHNIEMRLIWEMVETCIIPVLTYAGETRTPSKKENKDINNILDNILKRILMVPRTTPREVLYIETGMMDIEHICKKNRVNMEKRLNLDQNSIAYKVKENGAQNGWKKNTEEIKNAMRITPEDMEGSKEQAKQNIKRKTQQKFVENIETSGRNKSKVRHLLDNRTEEWKPGKPAEYMTKMTRKQVSLIFKARTRMLDIKDNFRNKSSNNTCRACSKENETQEHILNQCPAIHTDDKLKVNKEDLQSNNITTLKNVSEALEKIMNLLEQAK